MDLKSVFDHVIQGTNMTPLEVTAWLILTALFIWLYKEFKEDYQKRINRIANITDTSLSQYSKILKKYYESKQINNNPNEFFSTVYDCLPYMNVILMEEVLKDLDDISKNEQEKMNSIRNRILNEVKSIKNDNKEWKYIKLPIEGVVYFIKKFKTISYPVVMSMITIYIGTFFMHIWLSGSDANLNNLRVSAIIMMVAMIFIYLELLLTNMLRWRSVPIIILNLLSILALILQFRTDWIALTVSFIIFFLTIALLFIFGIKNRRQS